MDAEEATQQSQALTTNVEELIHKNEELRKAAKSHNEERQWIIKNQNEEER